MSSGKDDAFSMNDYFNHKSGTVGMGNDKTYLEYLKTGADYLMRAVGFLTIAIKMTMLEIKCWPVVRGVLVATLEEMRDEHPEAVAMIEEKAGLRVLDLSKTEEKVLNDA